MIVIPILAAWWVLLAFVAWAICRSAGQADQRIEGWRNRETL